jgi:adenylate kinase family enzyme
MISPENVKTNQKDLQGLSVFLINYALIVKNQFGLGRRISVIGTSGSGKTTTAEKIANIMQIEHIELDALHWGPDWSEAPIGEFRQRVTESLSGDYWVVDGNYGKVRDIVWPRADTIVWLDYSLPVIMWQLIRRTFKRLSQQEDLWSGNRETLSKTFLSKDSILLWALQTYKRRKRDYPQLFARPQNRHLSIVQMRTPKESRLMLTQLSQADNRI